ncbi:TetR/AcrR family transcriptional regulator [Cytobacillus horneckiae]|uniref:TetR/AcrR family transcriptional regulator n=1 Tax=Cytobacillus horneckiae TaxID=549687 RepID=A0A2N0ZAK7_9BACI|nr:TetR/AcrR family transcriptional regulator [Cytobacillus horneckiae]MEC1158934.1 TetR/AcrR family transcriptional regulator [Cytobacillus horneckiae]NRG44098.1 TetR/AcrR family transcriptional regulator [Bacillus sp. CRN 9]PKG26533.1 TetR/AcrR family transcriptional regulator [Cytobacillus horneckiae]
MSEKQDLRITRTRIYLKEALLDLISEIGYEAITIQKIADRALINRATFYLHYKDKHDLLDTVCAETFDKLRNSIKPCKYVQQKTVKLDTFEKTIETIFREIDNNRKFFKVMLSVERGNAFRFDLQKVIKEKFDLEFMNYGIQEVKLAIPPNFLTTFISSALVGIIKWWLEDGNHIPLESITKDTVKLYSLGPLRTAGFTIIN